MQGMNLRRLQSDCVDQVRLLPDGGGTVFVHGHCGGGKSWLPPLVLQQIRKSIPEMRVCWVVPRGALRLQAVRDAEMFGFKFTPIIGSAVDPCEGGDGFVTTYQSLRDGWKSFSDELELRPYLLVLDEFHHVYVDGTSQEKDSAGLRTTTPLFNAAHTRVLMSGSWERHDGKQIGFMPYYKVGEAYEPLTESSADRLRECEAFVRYSRRDALDERAVLPIKFMHHDGEVQYLDIDGKVQKRQLSAKQSQKASKQALYSALKTSYARMLLHSCLDHWSDRREGQVLVVCANIPQAEQIHTEICRRHFNAQVSTSKNDGDNAEIEAFKSGEYDILVTVGKAYEGLDVPAITHLCMLTHIRSRPWCEQAIHRATRVCKEHGPYGKQVAYEFVPDDILMQQIIKDIRDEQIAALRETGEPPPPRRRDSTCVVPLGSAVTQTRSTWLDDEYGQWLYPLTKRGHSQDEAVQILVEMGVLDPLEEMQRSIDLTEPQEIALVRQALQRVCAKIAAVRGVPPSHFNADIKRRFGARNKMTLAELRKLWKHLHERYGHEIQHA